MVTYYNGDLLKSKCIVICHQVNCKGVMGSGIAKQIRDKFPIVYELYRDRYKKGLNILGNIDLIPVTNSDIKIIANFYSQDDFLPRDIKHTDYDAFQICIDKLKDFCESREIYNIGFPYHIGCGLAGGDWSVVKKIIEKSFESDMWNVEVWKI